jgi:hypothetical protein
MTTNGFLPLAATFALAACAPVVRPSPPVAVTVEAPDPTSWRTIASEADTDRIARVDEAWTAALAEARRGSRAAIAQEGELLDPKGALPRAAPPPGPYRCRVIKLGRQGRGRAFQSFKPFFCHVQAEGALLSLVKQSGSQRPGGWLYADRDERMIFLGTLATAPDREPGAYGERRDADAVGVVERVAPFRWRLVFPWPQGDSKLDVIELVPAT